MVVVQRPGRETWMRNAVVEKKLRFGMGGVDCKKRNLTQRTPRTQRAQRKKKNQGKS